MLNPELFEAFKSALLSEMPVKNMEDKIIALSAQGMKKKQIYNLLLEFLVQLQGTKTPKGVIEEFEECIMYRFRAGWHNGYRILPNEPDV